MVLYRIFKLLFRCHVGTNIPISTKNYINNKNASQILSQEAGENIFQADKNVHFNVSTETLY